MLKLSDIMNRHVVAVREETTIKEVYALMRQYGISEFPVVNQDYKFKGMVYEADILRLLYPVENKKYYDSNDVESGASIAKRVPVGNIMTRKVRVAAPFSDVIQLGAEMLREKIKIAPVVEKDKLVGTVSASQVFMALAGAFFGGGALKQKLEIDSPGKPEPAVRPVFVNEYAGSERRRHDRLSVKMPVAYQLANLEGATLKKKGRLVSTIDISAGGMLLNTEEELPTGALVDLAFDLSGQGRPIKRLGRAVRCQFDEVTRTYHVGVMFLAMSSSEQAEIEKYIQSMLGR